MIMLAGERNRRRKEEMARVGERLGVLEELAHQVRAMWGPSLDQSGLEKRLQGVDDIGASHTAEIANLMERVEALEAMETRERELVTRMEMLERSMRQHTEGANTFANQLMERTRRETARLQG